MGAEDLVAEVARVAEREKYEYVRAWVKGQPVELITIDLDFFQELITSRCKLWALEAMGVDSWDGYAEAMFSEPLGDAWAYEIGRP